MDWTANGWTIIGLIVAVLGAAFSGGGYRWTDQYKARLENESTIRDKAAKALTAPGPLALYLRTLEAALDTLTRWMGKRVRLFPGDGERGDWGKSAGWCFTLAMIYPFIFLLVAWLFGGTGTVGEVEFLPPPESMSVGWRTVLVLSFLGYSFALYLLVRYEQRINQAATSWLDSHLWRRFPETQRKNAKILLPLGAGGILFGIFYIGLGLPLALALAGAVAVAVAVAEGTAANTFSATFLLFFLFLPFINAIFDWASWQVSRGLGDNLLRISK